MNTSNHRMIGLDLFRVIAAFTVFLFHSSIHMGCTYGIFQDFVSMGAVFMTGFFLLSGFVIFKTYSKREITKISEIKNFYLKRLITLIPVYYVTALLYTLTLDSKNIVDNLFLAPIELLGIQSTFSSLFSYSHNGGTWFISCLIICYLIYPYIQELVLQISLKGRFIIFVLCCFILLYAPVIVIIFKTANIYSNPFYRCLEFIIGILSASIIENTSDSRQYHLLRTWKFFWIELILFIAGISLAVKLNLFVNDYMLYNWINLPLSILMICTLSGVSSEKMQNSRIISYLGSISYCFFLAQFFTWKLTAFILRIINQDSNLFKIITSLIICTMLSILLYELVEKPFKKLFGK